MVSPYRTAPVERPAQKAPRASWWRRLTHRDVERRMDIRRRRHELHACYPWATWRERCSLATELWLMDHAERWDYGHDWAAYRLRAAIEACGPASPESRRPLPPPRTPLPSPGRPIRK